MTHQSTLLRLPEVIKRVSLSRSSIYAAIKAGKFPAPVSLLGKRSVAFQSDVIDAWIASRVTATTQKIEDVKTPSHATGARRIRRPMQAPCN